jgi:hypothetical protein
MKKRSHDELLRQLKVMPRAIGEPTVGEILNALIRDGWFPTASQRIGGDKTAKKRRTRPYIRRIVIQGLLEGSEMPPKYQAQPYGEKAIE